MPVLYTFDAPVAGSRSSVFTSILNEPTISAALKAGTFRHTTNRLWGPIQAGVASTAELAIAEGTSQTHHLTTLKTASGTTDVAAETFLSPRSHVDVQGIRLRSHRSAYNLAMSTTSSSRPFSKRVGLSPSSTRLLASTIRSFSGASFLGLGRYWICAPVSRETSLAKSSTRWVSVI